MLFQYLLPEAQHNGNWNRGVTDKKEHCYGLGKTLDDLLIRGTQQAKGLEDRLGTMKAHLEALSHYPKNGKTEITLKCKFQ